MMSDGVALISFYVGFVGLALGLGLLLLAVPRIEKPSLTPDDINRMGLS